MKAQIVFLYPPTYRPAKRRRNKRVEDGRDSQSLSRGEISLTYGPCSKKRKTKVGKRRKRGGRKAIPHVLSFLSLL